jgi:imidazolonepropionase-like amidohydrolase
MATIRRTHRAALAVAAALTVGSVALPAQTIAITGGRVYPVSGAPIENGTVLIRDGRIAAVGANVEIPANAQRIDASGRWVTPGLVNASTQLGVVEVGQVSATRDVRARGRDAIAAAFTVWDGFNPASALIAPARNEGITSVAVAPSGGLVAGQAAVLDLVENATVTEMVLRAPVGMVAQMGDAQQAGLSARGEVAVRLRELLEDTRLYARRRAEFERNQTRDFVASRLDLEAMIPVVEGRLPLLLNVDRASDIDAALRLADEYDLRLIITGGAEAWMVGERLAAAKVPVMTGAMVNIPFSFASLGARQENAAILRRAGVTVALIGNGPGDPETFNVRNLRQEAGNAVAYGMSWDDALRAVTLVPAEILGVADRVGSLQPGREANLVVWSGDPFELSTTVEHVIIRGREVSRDSRQDMLVRRYRTLPPAYGTPRAP